LQLLAANSNSDLLFLFKTTPFPTTMQRKEVQIKLLAEDLLLMTAMPKPVVVRMHRKNCLVLSARNSPRKRERSKEARTKAEGS
jgi:hypothetical protein